MGECTKKSGFRKKGDKAASLVYGKQREIRGGLR